MAWSLRCQKEGENERFVFLPGMERPFAYCFGLICHSDADGRDITCAGTKASHIAACGAGYSGRSLFCAAFRFGMGDCTISRQYGWWICAGQPLRGAAHWDFWACVYYGADMRRMFSNALCRTADDYGLAYYSAGRSPIWKDVSHCVGDSATFLAGAGHRIVCAAAA